MRNNKHCAFLKKLIEIKVDDYFEGWATFKNKADEYKNRFSPTSWEYKLLDVTT